MAESARAFTVGPVRGASYCRTSQSRLRPTSRHMQVTGYTRAMVTSSCCWGWKTLNAAHIAGLSQGCVSLSRPRAGLSEHTQAATVRTESSSSMRRLEHVDRRAVVEVSPPMFSRWSRDGVQWGSRVRLQQEDDRPGMAGRMTISAQSHSS
jgi:hypothetical protein